MQARKRYPARKDGEWFRIERRGHLLACCDCGLVHLIKSRITGRSIQIQAFRLPKNTGGMRKSMGVRVVRKD